jgi:hypothetical protein
VLRTQIRNTKSEARNKYKIRIFKCSKRKFSKKLVLCFAHFDFGNSHLPFDFTQGGELVEPFRISIFGFRIYTRYVSLWLVKVYIEQCYREFKKLEV